MMNQVMLVGRLTSIEEVGGEENKICNITLAVNRSFKNIDGIYETDFINCILWNGIATNAIEYLKKGDVVGVRGRLQSKKVEDNYVIEVVAEKLTFLSSTAGKKPDDINEEK